jgi:hypothetical protein
MKRYGDFSIGDMVKHRYKTNPTFGIVVNISEAPIWHVAEILYHVDWFSGVAKPMGHNGYALEHLEKVSQ